MKESKCCGNCIHRRPKEIPGHLHCSAKNTHVHESFGTTCVLHRFKLLTFDDNTQNDNPNVQQWKANSVECIVCKQAGVEENHSLDERGECGLCGTTFKGY